MLSKKRRNASNLEREMPSRTHAHFGTLVSHLIKVKTEIEQRKIRKNHVLTGKRKGNAEKSTLAHIPMLPIKLAVKSEKRKETKMPQRRTKENEKKGSTVKAARMMKNKRTFASLD